MQNGECLNGIKPCSYLKSKFFKCEFIFSDELYSATVVVVNARGAVRMKNLVR